MLKRIFMKSILMHAPKEHQTNTRKTDITFYTVDRATREHNFAHIFLILRQQQKLFRSIGCECGVRTP